MSSTNQELLDEVLALPADVRIRIVEKLLASLNLPSPREIDEFWLRTAELRAAEIDAGKVELVSGEKVFNQLRQKFSK